MPARRPLKREDYLWLSAILLLFLLIGLHAGWDNYDLRKAHHYHWGSRSIFWHTNGNGACYRIFLSCRVHYFWDFRNA